MPFDTTELREGRHKLIVDARAVLDKAEEEKRSLSAEDRTQYDRLMADANKAQTEIGDHERRNDLEREELAEKSRQEEETRKTKPEEETRVSVSDGPRASEEYRSGFDKFLTVPGGGTLQGNAFSKEERRALSAGTGTEGGYLYASEQFVDDLIRDVVDSTIYRSLARGIGIGNADSLGVPTLTDEMSDAEWTSELGAPSTDETLAFGKRALTPHPLAKEIRVSKVLLRKVPNAQSIVRSELTRVVGKANENGFMTGDGAQKPLGIFVASADGISTARDVSDGNTTTSPTFDGLKKAKYALKQEYWSAASWIFHRNGMELIALLKDGNGRYLLQDSVVLGEPDRMLGFPVNLSEFAPNTFTTGLYAGILGDHSNYWIVDALDMQIARAEELLIRSNQDLFIIRMETDGAPVREEAFVRVKLA